MPLPQIELNLSFNILGIYMYICIIKAKTISIKPSHFPLTTYYMFIINIILAPFYHSTTIQQNNQNQLPQTPQPLYPFALI